MRKILILGATAAAFALSGCGSKEEPTAMATETAEPAMEAAVPLDAATPTDGATMTPAATETAGAMESSAMPAATPT